MRLLAQTQYALRSSITRLLLARYTGMTPTANSPHYRPPPDAQLYQLVARLLHCYFPVAETRFLTLRCLSLAKRKRHTRNVTTGRLVPLHDDISQHIVIYPTFKRLFYVDFLQLKLRTKCVYYDINISKTSLTSYVALLISQHVPTCTLWSTASV